MRRQSKWNSTILLHRHLLLFLALQSPKLNDWRAEARLEGSHHARARGAKKKKRKKEKGKGRECSAKERKVIEARNEKKLKKKKKAHLAELDELAQARRDLVAKPAAGLAQSSAQLGRELCDFLEVLGHRLEAVPMGYLFLGG